MKKSKMIPIVLVGFCFLVLVSCGRDSGDSSIPAVTQLEEEKKEEASDQGTYRVVLSPLNPTVSGSISGTIEIRIKDDEVVAKSNIMGSPAGVKHLQNITSGGTCPAATADLNGDGYIDIAEALPSSGPILIPLDSDLSEQLDGIDFGPIANGSGNYIYRRSTALSALLADLQGEDPDPVDLVIKLSPGQNLNLAGRVIIIHGVDSSIPLPNSVVTTGDLSREEALPIACGAIVRITSTEASVETTSDLSM